jgi:hypothetical protein
MADAETIGSAIRGAPRGHPHEYRDQEFRHLRNYQCGTADQLRIGSHVIDTTGFVCGQILSTALARLDLPPRTTFPKETARRARQRLGHHQSTRPPLRRA